MNQASPARLQLAVLISGNGSNLQALIDAIEAKTLQADIVLVISDHAEAYGLTRAREHNIATAVVSKQDYPKRADFDAALAALLQPKRIDLIILAGYMRLLSAGFVNAFENRILNIHPSLLPKYRGLNTYERVLASGDPQHGTSVHIVTEDLDAGPILAQARCDINAGDTPESLKQRCQQLEHQLYPQVIQWFAEGRLSIQSDGICLDNQPLTTPLDM